ncbi:unnamed protein product [Dibothriocephalus latus]|uniref:Uncharacterized protein n=1 Tax=Dibothriocephalus latus TaxID=60516 RepID=A0A3P6QJS4_DIBLA|nr:unnamed protein product [Dibothriocephalus latus]
MMLATSSRRKPDTDNTAKNTPDKPIGDVVQQTGEDDATTLPLTDASKSKMTWDFDQADVFCWYAAYSDYLLPVESKIDCYSRINK